ncbi:hypothetical protein PFISCL1PPCAC_22316, partial [Pristionchus fissidentatus]
LIIQVAGDVKAEFKCSRYCEHSIATSLIVSQIFHRRDLNQQENVLKWANDRESSLANQIFTDKFLREFLTNKKDVSIDSLCEEVTAIGLRAVWEDLVGGKRVYFVIPVKVCAADFGRFGITSTSFFRC